MFYVIISVYEYVHISIDELHPKIYTYAYNNKQITINTKRKGKDNAVKEG